MELFGVQELPNAKSISAPGWAYVPDTGINPSVAALQPSQAKRARNLRNPSAHENSAKQDAKILRELAALDKESHKDVQIPVPVRHRDNAGRGSPFVIPLSETNSMLTLHALIVSHGKATPAVRKILQSQKTFANHLSDAEALAALSVSQPQSQPVAAPPTPVSRASPASTSTPVVPEKIPGKRGPYKKKSLNAVAASTPLREVSTPNPGSAAVSPAPPKGIKTETSNADILMTDPPNELLAPLPTSYELTSHPGDKDPLLISYIPPVPSQAELEKLIAAPPLTYMEAKGELTDEDVRKPTRSFCEICGYWGRVKCMKCGTRVCALECLRTHQEDCYTRYGV
jgi:zinc finger HIT domain-containing protein 1